MKFSMNGFRKELSNNAEELREAVLQSITGELYDEDRLIEVVNKIITQSNVINYVYNPDDPDFQELDLEVEHLELAK